jgi:hypothetical protein
VFEICPKRQYSAAEAYDYELKVLNGLGGLREEGRPNGEHELTSHSLHQMAIVSMVVGTLQQAVKNVVHDSHSKQRTTEQVVKQNERLEHDQRTMLKELKQVKDNESRLNADSTEQLAGEPICFGQIIQIRHKKSGRFLSIMPRTVAEEEKDCLRVSLLGGEGSAFSWFRVVARHNINHEGDRVLDSDEIYLVPERMSSYFLHMGKNNVRDSWHSPSFLSPTTTIHSSRDPNAPSWRRSMGGHCISTSGVQELNCSLSSTPFQLTCYSKCREGAGADAVIVTGDLIRLYHPDTRAFLRVHGKAGSRSVQLQPLGTDAENGDVSGEGGEVGQPIDHSSQSLWIVEGTSPKDGGVVRARANASGASADSRSMRFPGVQYRLRHLNSMTHLSVPVIGRVECTQPLGVQVPRSEGIARGASMGQAEGSTAFEFERIVRGEHKHASSTVIDNGSYLMIKNSLTDSYLTKGQAYRGTDPDEEEVDDSAVPSNVVTVPRVRPLTPGHNHRLASRAHNVMIVQKVETQEVRDALLCNTTACYLSAYLCWLEQQQLGAIEEREGPTKEEKPLAKLAGGTWIRDHVVVDINSRMYNDNMRAIKYLQRFVSGADMEKMTAAAAKLAKGLTGANDDDEQEGDTENDAGATAATAAGSAASGLSEVGTSATSSGVTNSLAWIRKQMLHEQGVLNLLMDITHATHKMLIHMPPSDSGKAVGKRAVKVRVRVRPRAEKKLKAIASAAFELLGLTMHQHHPSQMLVARRLPSFIEQIVCGMGAARMIRKMVDQNLELLETRVNEEAVDTFVSLMRRFGRRPEYLKLLIAICSCGGRGIVSNQSMILPHVFKQTNALDSKEPLPDLLLRVGVIPAADGSKQDWGYWRDPEWQEARRKRQNSKSRGIGSAVASGAVMIAKGIQSGAQQAGRLTIDGAKGTAGVGIKGAKIAAEGAVGVGSAGATVAIDGAKVTADVGIKGAKLVAGGVKAVATVGAGGVKKGVGLATAGTSDVVFDGIGRGVMTAGSIGSTATNAIKGAGVSAIKAGRKIVPIEGLRSVQQSPMAKHATEKLQKKFLASTTNLMERQAMGKHSENKDTITAYGFSRKDAKTAAKELIDTKFAAFDVETTYELPTASGLVHDEINVPLGFVKTRDGVEKMPLTDMVVWWDSVKKQAHIPGCDVLFTNDDLVPESWDEKLVAAQLTAQGYQRGHADAEAKKAHAAIAGHKNKLLEWQYLSSSAGALPEGAVLLELLARWCPKTSAEVPVSRLFQEQDQLEQLQQESEDRQEKEREAVFYGQDTSFYPTASTKSNTLDVRTRLWLQRTVVAQFFCDQINLFAELCLDRNQLSIGEIKVRFPYIAIVSAIANVDLPPSLRAAFCRLMLSLYVDATPQITLRLPVFSRPWYLDVFSAQAAANGDEYKISLSSSNKSHHVDGGAGGGGLELGFEGFGGKTASGSLLLPSVHPRTKSNQYCLLQELISDNLAKSIRAPSTMDGALDDSKGNDQLAQCTIELMHKLLSLGFYDTIDKLAPVLSTLMLRLDHRAPKFRQVRDPKFDQELFLIREERMRVLMAGAALTFTYTAAMNIRTMIENAMNGSRFMIFVLALVMLTSYTTIAGVEWTIGPYLFDEIVTLFFAIEVFIRINLLGIAEFLKDQYCVLDLGVTIIDLSFWVIEFVSESGGEGGGAKLLRVLRVLRFLRLLRLLRLSRYQQQLTSKTGSVGRNIFQLLKTSEGGGLTWRPPARYKSAVQDDMLISGMLRTLHVFLEVDELSQDLVLSKLVDGYVDTRTASRDSRNNLEDIGNIQINVAVDSGFSAFAREHERQAAIFAQHLQEFDDETEQQRDKSAVDSERRWGGAMHLGVHQEATSSMPRQAKKPESRKISPEMHPLEHDGGHSSSSGGHSNEHNSRHMVVRTKEQQRAWSEARASMRRELETALDVQGTMKKGAVARLVVQKVVAGTQQLELNTIAHHLPAFQAEIRGATGASLGRRASAAVEGIKDGAAALAGGSTTQLDLVEVLLDLLMYEHEGLAEKAATLLMQMHTSHTKVVKNVPQLMLLVTPGERQAYHILKQRMHRLQCAAEEHEVWGAVQTPEHLARNQEVVDDLYFVMSECKSPMRALDGLVHTRDEQFQDVRASAFSQEMLRHLGAVTMAMRFLRIKSSFFVGNSGRHGPNTADQQKRNKGMKKANHNTRKLLRLACTFLRWLCFNNGPNGELVFDEHIEYLMYLSRSHARSSARAKNAIDQDKIGDDESKIHDGYDDNNDKNGGVGSHVDRVIAQIFKNNASLNGKREWVGKLVRTAIDRLDAEYQQHTKSKTGSAATYLPSDWESVSVIEAMATASSGHNQMLVVLALSSNSGGDEMEEESMAQKVKQWLCLDETKYKYLINRSGTHAARAISQVSTPAMDDPEERPITPSKQGIRRRSRTSALTEVNTIAMWHGTHHHHHGTPSTRKAKTTLGPPKIATTNNDALGTRPLLFHTKLIDVLSACSMGKRSSVESKVQMLIPCKVVLRVLLDPISPPAVRVSYLRFLFHTYLDVQTRIGGFSKHPLIWRFLQHSRQEIEHLTSLLNSVVHDVDAHGQAAAPIRHVEMNEARKLKQLLALVSSGIMPCIAAFFDNYYDSDTIHDIERARQVPPSKHQGELTMFEVFADEAIAESVPDVAEEELPEVTVHKFVHRLCTAVTDLHTAIGRSINSTEKAPPKDAAHALIRSGPELRSPVTRSHLHFDRTSLERLCNMLHQCTRRMELGPALAFEGGGTEAHAKQRAYTKVKEFSGGMPTNEEGPKQKVSFHQIARPILYTARMVYTMLYCTHD